MEKTPDKIVLPNAAIEMHFLIDEVEYIKKETLIKWAKKMIADDKNRGFKGGFYMLIEYLNTL